MWNSYKDSNHGEMSSTTLQQEFSDTFQQSKFELKTLASLISSDSFSDDSLHCVSSPSFIIVSLGKRLSVFKEESFELYWETEFDFKCECLALADDFTLLLVVENPGTLHLLHLPTCKLIWSFSCKENDIHSTVQRIFICSNPSGLLSIFAYSKEGTLYAFSKIETTALYKAVEDGLVSTFFNDVNVEKVDLVHKFPCVSIKSTFETFHHTLPIGLESEINCSDLTLTDYYTIEEMIDGDFACDWESNNEEDHFFHLYDFTGYSNIIKIASVRDGRYVICLTSKHTLVIFCSYTQAVVAEWGDEDIENFTLKNSADPEDLSVSNYEMGILRKYRHGYIFEIRKIPSFDLIHKIQLSEFVHLVEAKPNQDSWYIVEEEQISYKSEMTKTLKIKSISETRPEARLLGLLKRRKFKDAEKYAALCSLDTEIIYKTKLNCMMKDYTEDPGLKLSKDEQEFLWEEIKDSLNKIKDVSFIKSCVLFLTPETEFMKKLISSINAWLTAHISYEGVEEVLCQLNKNENKVVTYNMLPNSLQVNLTLKEFLKKDLLQLMTSELIGGSLTTALIIWQRHKDEFLMSLTDEQVREILNAVPDDIPSQHLLSFLEEDFLPSVLSKMPEVVDVVADWIISHIHLLELTEKAFWPENGDQLASMFFKLLQVLHKKAGKGAISFTKSISLAAVHKNIINPDSRTGCLFELCKNLKLLVSLKENFNCKISLTTFQDSKLDVIFAVLDRINIKFISKAISEFARPYALENDLDLDLCLELYIKNTLQTSYFTWWSWNEAPWEEHLSLVLECIHDSTRWMNAALMLVSNATVPWSDRVKNIVEQGLNSNHPSAQEFKQQSRQVGLKEVLVKYEIRNFPINNDVELIYTLVNYILKLNRSSALEDAKKVVLSFNDSLISKVYFKCLQFYLNQNKLDEFISLSSSMPSGTAVECSYRLLHSVTFGLNDTFLIKNDKDQMKAYVEAGIYLTEFLKANKQTFDPELLDGLRCLKKLQKEFNLDVTLSDVMNKENALHIVEDAINSFLNKETVSHQGIAEKSTSISLGVFRIKRLGDILCLDRTSVTAILITSCLKRKMYNLVSILCRDLISSYPTIQSAEILMQVVNHFYQNFQNIKNMSFESIMDTVSYLSNLAITFCENDAIERSLYVVKLSTYFAVISKITGQHSSFLSPTYTADAFHKWKFSPTYDDEGFQLDVNITVDFVQKLLPLFLRSSSNLEQAIDFQLVDTFSLLFKPLITHMKEKGYGIAALRTLYLFYHLQMEFFQNVTSTQQTFQLIKQDIIEIMIQLIQRNIDKRKLDLDLSIGLLCAFTNEQAQILEKLQRWCSKDLRRLMSLGEIGYELFRFMGNVSKCAEYDKIYKRAVLLKQNIKSTTSDMVLNSSDTDYNWNIVKHIVLIPKANLSTVLDCCNAFDLVTDHVLIAFLNCLLLESDKTFANNLEILEGDLSAVLNQAKCVIEYIDAKELLINNLESLLKKIGSYSYEILFFLHEQLVSLAADILTVNSGYFEKGIPLLNFLQVYERVSPPSEIELEHWISLHPLDSKLPQISSKRLPFWILCSDKTYKIINPEMTANTLTVWLRIAPLLDISKDELVIVAIKNNVLNYLKKLPANHFVLNQDITFLRSIHDMLQYISDPKFSTASISWVSKRLPPGANKVYACMMAVKLAEQWCENSPTDRNALDIRKNLLALQQRSAVERILYQNNLASDEYLPYSHNPSQLIEKFTEEFCNSPESSMKVCKIAGEISKVVDIDLVNIFFRFFYKWLNISNDNLDESFAFNNSGDNDLHEDSNEDTNILRAINLLLGISTICPNICKDMKENYQKMTLIQRSRCVFCMVSVFDNVIVADTLNIPADIIKKSLALFLCASELEGLHILYSTDTIVNCDKRELIYRILCSQYSNPKVILCCIRMSLEFNIWCSQMWDTMLQRLVAMSKADSLQDILQTVQGKLVHMWHYKSFRSAWNCIISNQFKIESNDEPKAIEKIYKTILRCPCVTVLDVESLWNDLKYFVSNVSREKLKDMEPVSDIYSFLQALKSLQENCQCNVP